MSDAVVNGLAGAGGGIVSQVLTYPLLAVNTRQQTERKARGDRDVVEVVEAAGADAKASSTWAAQTGTIQEIFKVIRTEGWRGLYSGFMPSLLGTAISQGVYYYFYQLLRNEAEARARKKSMKPGNADASVGMLTSLVIAALAGCANVLLTNPIWVIVTRMQTHVQAQKRSEMTANNAITRPSGYSVVPSVDSSTTSTSYPCSSTAGQGTLETVKELYKEAGVRGFWKGVLPSLIMVCNPAVQFMLYEGMLKKLTEKRVVTSRGVKYVSASEVFLLGAIAKLGATVVTYPLLVVKSRLQAKQEIGGDKFSQYTGTLDAIVKMVRFEGLTGFYKGMSTKIVQSVAAAAILFMIKEELVKAARAVVTKQVKVPKVTKLKSSS